MKPRFSGYRTFAEIADEMAKKRHGDFWPAHRNDYLGNLVCNAWGGRFPDDGKQSRLFYLSAGGEPEPITREVLWLLIGTSNRPQAVREALDGAPAPCAVLAVTGLEQYSDATVRDLFENLVLLEVDARNWMQEYCEKHPLNVGGRKTDAESQRPAILYAYDKLCAEGKVSFGRGGLARAVRDLAPQFQGYKEDSIRKIIQGSHNERKIRAQTARVD